MSKSLINPLTGAVISLTGSLFDPTMISAKKSTVADSLESDHYCTESYFNVSDSKPSTYAGLLVTWLTLTSII